MKLKESLKRLRWRFSPDEKGVFKQMTPNATDVEAFNSILDFIEKTQQETVQENLLFAKLYCFLLENLTIRYTDIDFANKELNKVLSESLAIRIESLKLNLKDMEYRNYFNRKGILDPFLKTKTSKELEEIHERYKDKLPVLDVQEFLKCGNNWDFESVKYQLENQINQSIQNFKNYA